MTLRDTAPAVVPEPPEPPKEDEPEVVPPAAPVEPAEIDLTREHLPYNYPPVDEMERVLADPSYWSCMGMGIYNIGLSEINKSVFTSERAYRKYYNKLRELRMKCAIVQGYDISGFPAALPEDGEPAAPPPPPVAPKPAAPAEIDLTKESLPGNYPSIREIEELLADATYFNCFIAYGINAIGMSQVDRKHFSSERAYRKYYNKLLEVKLKCARVQGHDTSSAPSFLPEDDDPAVSPVAPVAPQPSAPVVVDLKQEDLPYNYPTIDEIEELIANHESFECIVAFKVNAIGLDDIDKSEFTSELAYRKYYNKLREAKLLCAIERGYDTSNFPAPLPEDGGGAPAAPSSGSGDDFWWEADDISDVQRVSADRELVQYLYDLPRNRSISSESISRNIGEWIVKSEIERRRRRAYWTHLEHLTDVYSSVAVFDPFDDDLPSETDEYDRAIPRNQSVFYGGGT